MLSTLALFTLSLSSVLALPGPRNLQHHHHAKRDDVVVYATVQVTEYVTLTAGQSEPTSSAVQAGNVVLASTSIPSPTTLATSIIAVSVQTNTPSSTTPQVVPETSTSAISTPTLAASSTTSTSSGTKRGLAWASSNPSSMASLFSSSALSWYFNWGTGKTAAISKTFIYQQWGSDNMANVKSLPTGSTLIGFNEPDGTNQATMSPAQAAALYKANFTPLRKTGQIGYLGTPSITNGASGITWLTEFMAACSDCEIDFISAHWYGPDMALLKSQMSAINTAFGLPIWLTEFACTNWSVSTNPGASQIATFMQDAVAWLEETSYIAKYAWFGAMVITEEALGTANSLVTSDGSALSSLGKLYLSL